MHASAEQKGRPSRYDRDELHDANPLVLGTRTGRPSDAPIPLCLGKTPALAIPPSGSSRGMAPRLFVASTGRKVQMQSAGSGHWSTDRGLCDKPTKAGLARNGTRAVA